jgi:BolA protein
MQRSQAIKAALEEGLDAQVVELIDLSDRHAGHTGSEGGGGHFQVLVVSERFHDVSRVTAQRLVYAALGDLMKTEIHALSMRTLTPDEWTLEETK